MHGPVRIHPPQWMLVLCGVICFCANARTVLAQRPPIIISDANSTRAIALDSVTLVKEPFQLSNRFAGDGRTRVMVFALNVPAVPDGSVLAPTNWTTLRVVTGSDGLIQVYTDATFLGSTSTPTLASATGAGLFNNSSGLGLINRWDNFTPSSERLHKRMVS